MENEEIKNQEALSKKERRELRRKEKEMLKISREKSARQKSIGVWTLTSAVIALAIGGLVWFAGTRSPIPENEIVSRNGFHWHPKLYISVKGQKIDLPENIGIGAIHEPIHTHDDDNLDGVIHMEFEGLVQKRHITLGQFFKNWGKDMRSFGANMKMTVNGTENTEYENYIMRDNDVIELQFD